MVVRARIAATSSPPRRAWPWHTAKWKAVSLRALTTGDRRLEAETYLSEGHLIREVVRGRASSWKCLRDFARIWQPSRLKGIIVDKDSGAPFLAATQVFDIRPVPRKWLAIERTSDASQRFVANGTILITCSGSVGRATLAHAPHDGVLISHDLLRVEPRDPDHWGWLYAYLRSPQARAMMTGAQYGHIIKHLETSHLEALPIPDVPDSTAQKFQRLTREILERRNRGHELTLAAEERFEQALGTLKIRDWGEDGFSIKASACFYGRRRLDATPHNPGIHTVWRHLAKHGKGFITVREAGFAVWLPTRFRRIPAVDGVWLLDSADLFETNPDRTKRIAECDFGDPYSGRVMTGWLLLARSGQTYGLNGSLVLATKALEDKVISDHIIRIAPGKNVKLRVGYVHTALSHPVLGRPLVKSLAYGSSIPEIEPTDFAEMEIVRLPSHEEDTIADLAEESARVRAEADLLERQLADDAAAVVDRCLVTVDKKVRG